VVKVNVDENPQLAAHFQAMSIPLLVIMRDRREIDRVVGAVPKPQVVERGRSSSAPTSTRPRDSRPGRELMQDLPAQSRMTVISSNGR
jgi:thioredoxin-like negative regulator of GroEL